MYMNLNYVKQNIYVLNIQQLNKICDKLGIDYNIYIETDDGMRKINDKLHKEFIIDKILGVLNGKKDRVVVYSKTIQNYGTTEHLKKTNYVYYGQYKTTDKNVKRIMVKLTNGKFKFGAISQKVVKKHWAQNKLLTYENFSKLWLEEYNSGAINYDELAYNNFMKKYGDKNKWFAEKAKIVATFEKMKLL